jgi:EAL and modified HD-GYP domain-containing signal transduction protein
MKRHGYLLVLDDFVIKPESRPFIKYADIIKVDFLATPVEQRRALVQALKSTGIKLLAEKVETQADFEEAVEMGYSFFQGYFFAKPVVISGKDVPSYKLTYLQLIQKVNQPEIDFDELEQVIKQDVSLSYKLLHFINSASFGVRNRIHSIKYALVLLGGKEIAKWVSLIALKGMASDKPNELLVNSIIRARFCELLAPLVGLEDRSQDLFLMGMFSLIDAVMDQPLPELLAQLPIASDIKSALLGKTGPLLKVYELIQAYERADWDRLPVMGARINLDILRLPGIYHQSLEWTDEIFLG